MFFRDPTKTPCRKKRHRLASSISPIQSIQVVSLISHRMAIPYTILPPPPPPPPYPPLHTICYVAAYPSCINDPRRAPSNQKHSIQRTYLFPSTLVSSRIHVWYKLKNNKRKKPLPRPRAPPSPEYHIVASTSPVKNKPQAKPNQIKKEKNKKGKKEKTITFTFTYTD